MDEAVRKVLAYKPAVIDAGPEYARRLEHRGDPPDAGRLPGHGDRRLLMTMEDEPRFAREALRAGALGFVLKEAADT